MNLSLVKPLLFAFSLLIAAPLAADSHEPSGQADAAALLGSAQRAVGQVVRAAQANPNLDAGKAEAKPFWDAMKQVNEALEKAQTGLSLKDDTFFTNVASARAQVIQAEVAVSMNGGGDQALSSSMATLSSLVTKLDENYSKEAARLKQGGNLTRDERRQLDELKKQQKELMAKLDQVERNAAKNNKEMQEGIKKIREQSEKVRKSGNTAAGFVGGFIAARLMSSWMWGWHWWWGPWGAWCPGWIDINIIIWDDWLDVALYDWALVDAAVDIGDLDLDLLDISDEELAATDEFLIDGDFSLDDGDLRAMTSDMELGWDEVETDTGRDIMDQMEDNFDSAPFDQGFEANTFEDRGMSDFGDDFGGGDDFDF